MRAGSTSGDLLLTSNPPKNHPLSKPAREEPINRTLTCTGIATSKNYIYWFCYGWNLSLPTLLVIATSGTIRLERRVSRAGGRHYLSSH